MRPVLILSTALIAACAASGAAMAQQSAGAQSANGLRYLSWPGKPPVAPAPTLRRIAPQPAPVATPVAAFDAPRPLAMARLDAPAAGSTSRRGLTPASAWAAAPPSAPAPASTLQPYAPSRDVAIDAPRPSVRAEAVPAPAPSPLPEQVRMEAQGQAEAAPVFDPMAPRRDAPIFRLQPQTVAEAPPLPVPAAENPGAGPAPAPQPTMVQAALSASPAPVLGARFYSVHRQAGRRPDPINAVQPVYLDALPVEMTQTPSSTDLAQPDAPQALSRDSDGKLRAAPQTQGDDLP